MFAKIKRSIPVAFAMFLLAVVPVAASASPLSPLAQPAASCPESVFGFPAWYRGVINTGTCEMKIDAISDFVKIPLNLIQALILAVAYVAVGFVIWGGFKYMKSQGDPGKISEAKTAIVNAVTGLGIALASVAIVEFVQGRIV